MRDVVDVCLHVAAQLGPKTSLHGALKGCAGVPEIKRRPGVAVAALGCDEGRLLLILHCHHDLVLPGESIQEAQELAPGG